jgi:hypothetical protein
VPHGTVMELMAGCGVDADAVAAACRELMVD